MAEPAIVLGQLDQLDPENRLKGIEVNADLDDPIEVERLYAYGHLLKARHKKLQIHSPHGFSKLYNETSCLDKYLSIYADLAKKTANMPFHYHSSCRIRPKRKSKVSHP